MVDLTVADLALRRGQTEILKGVSVTVPAGKQERTASSESHPLARVPSMLLTRCITCE